MERLSHHPTWLKLLHYNEHEKQSSITDTNFFLDKDGRWSPKKELMKTLEAYNEPFSSDANKSNQHAQCRYPARYFWLSQQIKLKDYHLINEHCSNLKKWKLLKHSDSISVVFVSGYLGNPASAFGHSFIKINQSNNENENLFDTSISYGALLPPDYTMFDYMVKGVTGGYDASYSDQYYYNQDITYSNQEFREMWEYRLRLTEEQKQLFLFHAWELMGKKFQYYFFNRNCGYKVSEFLELMYEKPIIEHATVWYAPIETFYTLKEFDTQSSQGIIDKIVYIPSTQQKLYSRYKELSTLEKKVVNLMIEKGLSEIPIFYQSLDVNQQTAILDFILLYRHYRFNNKEKPIDKKEEQLSNALILNRFKLPMSQIKHKEIEQKAPITQSNKASFVGLSTRHQDGKVFPSLHFAPFAIEKQGYNHFNGDELVVLDTQISTDNTKLYLKKCDLIRIQRLKSQQMPFESENPFSWSVQVGVNKNEDRDYFTQGGIGLAWELNHFIHYYSMMNFSLHSDDAHYRYMPNMGVYANLNRLRVTGSLGYEQDMENHQEQQVVLLNAQYTVKDNLSVFLEYDNREKMRTQFGVKWFY